MKVHKRTETMTKIIESMDLVYEKLIEYKKKIDSPLVVLEDGKIVYIKPWLKK